MDRCDSPESDKHVVDTMREALSGVLAIYQFGSAGTWHMRADSDLDLGLLSARPEYSVLVWDLAQRNDANVGRDVDLVDLRCATR